MPVHRTVHARAARGMQGMVASASYGRRDHMFFWFMQSLRRPAQRRRVPAANKASAAAIDEGNGFPGRGVAYAKDMYPLRWTRHGSTQCR
jgi:hypothetical protein